MVRVVRGALTLMFGLALCVAGVSVAADKDLTIKEVMKKAHTGKPKLCEKVVSGKATKEEKQELVDLYTAMAKDKPPKGDADSWKDKTEALVAAAKSCLADDKDGPDKLKKAVNCKSCHEAHKGK
jgi:hypothetical protein